MKKSLVLLLVLLLLIATGCDSKTIKTDTELIQEKIPEAIATGDLDASKNPAYSRGNVLIVSTPSIDGKFNPLLSESMSDGWVSDLIFDGLVTNDHLGNAIPALAREWKLSEDELTYTFYLREGITFHDGRPLTAHDVEFTYMVLADKNYEGPRENVILDIAGLSEYRDGSADKLMGIEVIDNLTISFTVTEASAKKIWDFTIGIIPRHYYAYENYENFRMNVSNPMGSGIMKFEEYKPGEYIKLSSFEGFRNGKSNIDGVLIKIQANDISAVSFAAGDIDVVNPPLSLESYDIMISTGVGVVQEFMENGYNYIGFNLRNPKLEDKRVRQALAYGFDRKTFVEAQWEGFASVHNSPISPVSWALPSRFSLNSYEYNIEKARELLDEAGWIDTDGDGIRDKDGLKLSLFWTSYSDVGWSINLIMAAREQWRKIGVELEYELMEFGPFLTKVFEDQSCEIWNMGWSFSIDPDPTPIFSKKSDIAGGYNAGGYFSERAEELFSLGLKEFDRDKRAAIYKEWATIGNEELPYLFLSAKNELWGVNTRIRGMELGSYYSWVDNVINNSIEIDYLN